MFFISFEKDIDMSVVSCDETSVGFQAKKVDKEQSNFSGRGPNLNGLLKGLTFHSKFKILPVN